MNKSFKDSMKALQADIHHANTLVSDYPLDYDDCHIAACWYFWADQKAYGDGKTTMPVYEKKASLREFFYGVIFPSLVQLHGGITDIEERRQREVCVTKYKKRCEIVKAKLFDRKRRRMRNLHGIKHHSRASEL